MARVECLLDRGDNPSLHGHGSAGNASAGGGRMAATPKLRGDFVHVHCSAFRAEADPRQFRFQFLEDTSHHYRRDGADVIDEALGVAALGACASEVGLFEPEIGDLIVVSEAEVPVNVPEETRSGERVGLIYFVTDFCEI